MPGKLWLIKEWPIAIKKMTTTWPIGPKPVFAATGLTMLAALLVIIVVGGGLRADTVIPPAKLPPVEKEAFIINAHSSDQQAAPLENRQQLTKTPKEDAATADAQMAEKPLAALPENPQSKPLGEQSAPPEPAVTEQPLSQPGDWPVNGQVRLAFGWQFYPVFKDWRYHTGINIDTPENSSIQAVWDGVVSGVYTSERTGLTVEVNSGQYTAVYGSLSAVDVKEGSRVARGIRIGSAGNSPGEPYPHLYFAVKQDDKYIDPVTVLK